MAKLIDVRNSGGSLVVLGESIVLPAAGRPSDPVPGALRRDAATGVVEVFTGPSGGPFAWVTVAAEAAPVIIDQYVRGTMTNNAVVLRFVAPFAMMIPAGGAGSYANAGTAANNNTVLTVRRNGINVGTLTFASGANNATVSVPALSNVMAGDVITVSAPASADSALADVAITILGSRV